MKKGALFCLKGFIREPKPTKKGIRVLLGILVEYRDSQRGGETRETSQTAQLIPNSKKKPPVL